MTSDARTRSCRLQGVEEVEDQMLTLLPDSCR